MGMTTVVLSGPAIHRAKAVTALRQAGFSVDDGEHGHGFTPEPEQTFITAHGSHPDKAISAVDHLSWNLRSHWAKAEPWQKLGRPNHDEAAELRKELAQLKASLRANGLILPEGV